MSKTLHLRICETSCKVGSKGKKGDTFIVTCLPFLLFPKESAALPPVRQNAFYKSVKLCAVVFVDNMRKLVNNNIVYCLVRKLHQPP